MTNKTAKTSRHAPEEVDAYLEQLPEDVRASLQRLREIIHETVPNCTERVSYGMPIFRLKHDLVGMAAHTNHCSLHSMHTGLKADFGEDLKGFTIANSSVHFSPQKPLPREAVEKILRFRMSLAG